MMIIYGMLAEESVAKLFVAGAIPGILMGIALMILVYFIAKNGNTRILNFLGGKIILKSFFSAIPPLMTPVTMMGGILGGIFTPTEAAAVDGLLLTLFSNSSAAPL